MTVENLAVFAKSACYLTTHIWNWIHYCFSVFIFTMCLAVKHGKWQPKLGFVFFVLYKFQYRIYLVLIPLVAQCKAWVCGRTLVGIAGSNPAGGMDVCLL